MIEILWIGVEEMSRDLELGCDIEIKEGR